MLSKEDRILVAGSSGMAGSAILRKLIESGYGLKKNNGTIFAPQRIDLDLENKKDVEEWLRKKTFSYYYCSCKSWGNFSKCNISR